MKIEAGLSIINSDAYLTNMVVDSNQSGSYTVEVYMFIIVLTQLYFDNMSIS